MAETAVERLTRGYAFSIFIYGTRTFAETNTTYHPGIKKYAAVNFTDEQINHAYSQGWITQAEFDETMAIRYPNGIPEEGQPQEETFSDEQPFEETNTPIDEE